MVEDGKYKFGILMDAKSDNFMRGLMEQILTYAKKHDTPDLSLTTRTLISIAGANLAVAGFKDADVEEFIPTFVRILKGNFEACKSLNGE